MLIFSVSFYSPNKTVSCILFFSPPFDLLFTDEKTESQRLSDYLMAEVGLEEDFPKHVFTFRRNSPFLALEPVGTWKRTELEGTTSWAPSHGLFLSVAEFVPEVNLHDFTVSHSSWYWKLFPLLAKFMNYEFKKSIEISSNICQLFNSLSLL